METIEHQGWQGHLGLGLTAQQIRCLITCMLGNKDKETARVLGLSHTTVKTYMNRSLCNLRCSSRAQLVAEAMRRAIITPLLLMLAICMMAVQATPDHQPVTRNRIVRVKGGARRDADVSVFRIC